MKQYNYLSPKLGIFQNLKLLEYFSAHPQMEAPTPPLLGGWIQYTEGIFKITFRLHV